MTVPRAISVTRNRGIALVVVLWTLAVLGILASSFLAGMRTELRLAHNLLAATQARQLADAGIARALYDLLYPDPAQRPVADGDPHTMTVDAAVVTIRIVDESAKLDLNKAPVELLTGLFGGITLQGDAGITLADCILDWRDADHLRHLNGAEDNDYRLAHRAYGAKDAAFDSLEELLLIPGMSTELYTQVAPLLTVYSGQPGIDPGFTPAAILHALPSITPEQVDDYLVVRRTFRAAGLAPPVPEFVDRRYLSPSRGLVYTVRVQTQLPGGASAAVETTVRLQRNNSERPVVILRWRETDSVTSESSQSPADGSNI